MDIKGSIALVTGASRGVGKAIALALAEEGASVACAARATDHSPLPLPGTLDETVREIEKRGQRGLSVPTNLSRESDVQAMVERTVEAFGRVDILVNNAAVTFPGDLDIEMKRHDLTMEINARAPLLAIRAVMGGMIERGRGAILNISSNSATPTYYPGLLSYAMSKAALEQLTIYAANHLRPHGISVNGFRINLAIASEGYVANTPKADHSQWLPTSVPAEGSIWLLRQPLEYTANNVSMTELRERYGIMSS